MAAGATDFSTRSGMVCVSGAVRAGASITMSCSDRDLRFWVMTSSFHKPKLSARLALTCRTLGFLCCRLRLALALPRDRHQHFLLAACRLARLLGGLGRLRWRGTADA